jgi:Uma2 family endonuclease
MATSLDRWRHELPPQPEAGDWEWYPSHGEPPLTDTEVQRFEREALYWVLARRFAEREDWYLGADMFVYYEMGQRNKKLAPDLFVCMGVPRLSRRRRVYKTWEERHGVDWALEIVSKGTWREDVGDKRELYARRLGVQEYFVYDPEGMYLDAPLLAYRAREGELVQDPLHEALRSRSALLGLDLVVRPHEEGLQRWRLDFHLPDGTRLLRRDEALEREREERQREAEARHAAEEELERLREELRRLREGA